VGRSEARLELPHPRSGPLRFEPTPPSERDALGPLIAGLPLRAGSNDTLPRLQGLGHGQAPPRGGWLCTPAGQSALTQGCNTGGSRNSRRERGGQLLARHGTVLALSRGPAASAEFGFDSPPLGCRGRCSAILGAALREGGSKQGLDETRRQDKGRSHW